MYTNIFSELFRWCSTSNMTPEENFLTSSFAGLLHVHSTIAHAFSQWAFEGVAVVKTDTRVVVSGTQVTRRTLDGRVIFPDLELSCELADGRAGLIRCENKWNAPLNPGQLDAYRSIPDDGCCVRLLFISSDGFDVANAKTMCDLAARWSDIAAFLAPWKHDPLVSQWIDFAQNNGAFGLPKPEEQRERLEHCARACKVIHSLAAEWLHLPDPLQGRVRLLAPEPKYQRTALCLGLDDRTRFKMADNERLHCLMMGFRVGSNDVDHPLRDLGFGADLFLATHFPPGTSVLPLVLASAETRLLDANSNSGWQLEVVHDPSGRKWHTLFVNAPCSSLGVDSSDAQALGAAAAERLRSWIDVICGDSAFVEYLRSVWPG